MSAQFRGTSLAQDGRFKDKDAELVKKLPFPPSFTRKLDRTKILVDPIKHHIRSTIPTLLGLDDDIVTELACNLLDEPDWDPRKWQVTLTGFLEGKAEGFVRELWGLLVAAEEDGGVPRGWREREEELVRERERDRREAEGVVRDREKRRREEGKREHKSSKRSKRD
jgi:serine/arginine repetitive matrix protein 1